MGQAKIRKLKGEYPTTESELKLLAKQRRKPLPKNDKYHFPRLHGKDSCLCFCESYSGSEFDAEEYEEHIRETIEIGEMAAHIILFGCRVTFGASQGSAGEQMMHDIMIPACLRVLSEFDVTPTAEDYEERTVEKYVNSML